jgi:hypothetical protein
MSYADDTDREGSRDSRRGLSFGQKLAVMGAIGLCLAPLWSRLARRRVALKEFAATDARVDKSLKDTFPASDPPSQHFTDIPINRQ